MLPNHSNLAEFKALFQDLGLKGSGDTFTIKYKYSKDILTVSINLNDSAKNPMVYHHMILRFNNLIVEIGLNLGGINQYAHLHSSALPVTKNETYSFTVTDLELLRKKRAALLEEKNKEKKKTETIKQERAINQQKKRQVDDMAKIINAVYSNSSKDAVSLITPNPISEKYPEGGWYIEWKSKPKSSNEDFPLDDKLSGSIITETQYNQIYRTMVPINSTMKGSALLKQQLSARLSFINELEDLKTSDNSEMKNDTSRWNWEEYGQLTPSQELAPRKKEFSNYLEKKEFTPADEDQIRKSMSSFDGLVRTHLVDSKREEALDNISDNRRHMVIKSLNNEAVRLHCKYGLELDGSRDTQNKETMKYGEDIITIAKNRITEINKLTEELQGSYDPDRVYKGTAQPDKITEEQLINKLNALKSKMISTGYFHAGSIREGFFARHGFFSVTSATHIDKIINDLNPKPGIFQRIIRMITPTK